MNGDNKTFTDPNGVDASITDSQEVHLQLEEMEFTLTESTAQSLNSVLDRSLEEIEAATTGLEVIYKRGKFLNTLHITGEHGCLHGGLKSSHSRDLNLREFSKLPVRGRYGRWVTGEREEPLAIGEFIDLFFCKACRSYVEFWHQQRKVFLPELADSLSKTVARTDFEKEPSQGTPCGICGTADSGMWKLDTPAHVYERQGPFKLCLTCRDLLIETQDSLPFDQLSPEEHPATERNSDIYSMKTILQSPKASIPNEETDPHADHRQMSRSEFVEIVGGFAHVSEATADRLFSDGHTSVPALAEAPKKSLTETTFVGSATAEKIQAQATDWLETAPPG